MIDYAALAEKKTNIERRLSQAIRYIGSSFAHGPHSRKAFDGLAMCIKPEIAYEFDREMRLPHGWPVREQTSYPDEQQVVLHEIHQAVVLYWDLIRTDQALGLDRLVERIEDYAKHGFGKCDLLGGPDGYYLFFPPEVRA